MTAYQLRHYRTCKLLSKHPNVNGAKLSALFHLRNGARITWDKDGSRPTQVGYFNGQPEFFIEPVEEGTQ